MTPRGFTVTVNRYAATIKWVSIVLMVVSILLIFRQLPIGPAVQRMENWIGDLGIWGPVAFGLLYVVAVVLLVPASALTLAAGALFGLVGGTVIVSLASTTGAALAFLISRYLARNWIAKKVEQYPKFGAIDKALSEGGWRIVALLRLSPAIPFNLQNYLYGLTGIRFWTCVLTSWVAMLPGTFMYVYLGYVGRAGIEATGGGGQSWSPAEWAIMIVGLIATITVTVYVTHMARKALKKHADVAEPSKPSESQSNDQLEPKGWPWGAMTTALIALAALGAAIFVQFNPDRFQQLFGNVLGSSLVTLAGHGCCAPEGADAEECCSPIAKNGPQKISRDEIIEAIIDSIAVMDQVLKRDLPQGPGWWRYDHDGYEQKADGSAYDWTGEGHRWPILTGERAHYELAAGHDPLPVIETMEKFANEGGMLTEQFWDSDDLPDGKMTRGSPTGSVMPRRWSHAEHVSLVRSHKDGGCFDRIERVCQRYAKARTSSKIEMWTLAHPVQRIAQGKTLCEFAFAGMKPADAEKAGLKLVSASAESRDIGKLHLAGDDFGFGELCADANSARLLSARLLCDDASNLIHLPAYTIDHKHTVHQLEDAEYYHPTKIEIISETGDALCRQLGDHSFARAEE